MKVIYEQVDRTGEKFTYSWILDGVRKERAALLPGWKWLRGRPGCFVTNDPERVVEASNRFGCDVVTNGTHKAQNAAVLLCDPRAA